MADEISKRSGATDVELDSFIISETRYEELHKNYDDGTWDREKFAAKHILFPERSAGYDYLAKILQSTGE